MSYNKTSNRKLGYFEAFFWECIFLPLNFSCNTSATLSQNCMHINSIKKTDPNESYKTYINKWI